MKQDKAKVVKFTNTYILVQATIFILELRKTQLGAFKVGLKLRMVKLESIT